MQSERSSGSKERAWAIRDTAHLPLGHPVPAERPDSRRKTLWGGAEWCGGPGAEGEGFTFQDAHGSLSQRYPTRMKGPENRPPSTAIAALTPAAWPRSLPRTGSHTARRHPTVNSVHVEEGHVARSTRNTSALTNDVCAYAHTSVADSACSGHK